jgi:hypothetical protein
MNKLKHDNQCTKIEQTARSSVLGKISRAFRYRLPRLQETVLYLRYRHIRSQFGSVRYHLEFVAEGGSILTVEDKKGLGKVVENKDAPAVWKRTKLDMTNL